jgi:myo-inositol-1(or 4)-monophosphatase
LPAAEPSHGLAAELAPIAEAVRAAGAAALEFYGKAPRVWRKHDRSPVCEADHAAEEVLKSRLTGARPDYGWMSEESGFAAESPNGYSDARNWSAYGECRLR